MRRSGAPRFGRRLPFLALSLVAGLLAGCEGIGPAGESGLADELLRIKGEKGIALISSRPDRAVFAVRGARVVVAPPKGYCLDEKSVEVTQRAAFTLIADCLTDRQAAVAQDDGKGNVVAIALPRSFPGILTVSISGELTLQPEEGGLESFEQALAGPSGQARLARGAGSDGGQVIETRSLGGAVYVLAEDEAGSNVILAPRFWRAFTTLSGRLAMVTVSSFSDRPAGEEAMLAFLASAMAALRAANGVGSDAEEVRIAGGLESSLAKLPASEAEAGVEVAVIRDDAPVQLSDGTDPGKSPLPPARKRAGGGKKIAAATAAGSAKPAPRPAAQSATGSAAAASSGSGQAPALAPKAPRKPR